MGKTKLAIVGFSEKSRDLAPYDDPEWEIWGCNHVYRYAPRLDVIFEIHRLGELEAKYGPEKWKVYSDYLKTTDALVWMMDTSEDFPAVHRLPIEELEEEFSYHLEHIEFEGLKVDHRKVTNRTTSEYAQFKSTLSYMLAMAIRENRFKTIAVYGVDMTVDSEWWFQRNNFSFFLGWCRGNGINLVLPDMCALLREGGFRLYGYDSGDAEKYKDVIAHLGTDIKKIDAEMQELDLENEIMVARMSEMVGAIKVLSQLGETEQFNGHRELLDKKRQEIRADEAKLREKQSAHLRGLYELSGGRKKAFALMERLGAHNRGEMPEGRA